MKVHFFRPLTFAMLIIFLIAGCKKKDDDQPVTSTNSGSQDNTIPVITLNGDSYVELSRNATFDDPGATAVDDVDGDISDRIQITSNLDSSKFGLYNIVYSVQDDAGNAANPVVRNVEVVFGRDDYLGTYNVEAADDCSENTQLNSPQEIVPGVNPNEITFTNVLPIFGGSIPATVEGRSVSLIETNLQGFLTITGNGEIDREGKVMEINLTIANSLPFIGGTETCTVVYTKLQ